MTDQRLDSPDGPVSMDGRVLRSVANHGDGEVGGDTRFQFDQDGDVVHARYEGGAVRLHETWAWNSKEGSGTGILEEVEE